MLTHNLGFPRIGARRELKKACEKYWSGKITHDELIEAGRLEREKNWRIQQEAGIDLIPCNDFSFYDHVQDMTCMLGAIPERYYPFKETLSAEDLYFAMCRGYQKDGSEVIAMEMTKWFDTNYHYIVPEFVRDQPFELAGEKAVDEFKEAKAFGVKNPKPVLIGPVTYLLSGKEKEKGFDRLDLIDQLTPAYYQLLEKLAGAGCEYVQLDEPFLTTELDIKTRSVYRDVYEAINRRFPQLKIILACYFGDLGGNLETALYLPVHALHIDATKDREQVEKAVAAAPENLNISLGLIDGRNIWKNNFEDSLQLMEQAAGILGENRLLIAPSCSLLHCPYDLDNETNERALPAAVKRWMAFSKQKLQELNALSRLFRKQDWNLLVENSKAIQNRRSSHLIVNESVRQKVKELAGKTIGRNSPYEERAKKQKQKLNLPLFPTTTIGSFPQTPEVRKKRREFKNNLISLEDYENFLKKETEKTVKWQEAIGLDVLVHGEYERNDMVEYFGEQLEGFAFTEHGWVQSYGSRGVKPPVIYGDVFRKEPMTVKWSAFAQSLTSRRVKGMLTGPVTILQWSFVRDDQPRETTAMQIALAIRDEARDLEKAGIEIIQIDEPALREGLPLKRSQWREYLSWAVKAFRICFWGLKDETQLHTHMCYSEFNDIIESIAALDADVISIETSRSQMELLDAFVNFNYPNEIGPGVYDIHSPRIPSKDEMESLLRKAAELIEPEKLWVNPDCGLKTRRWPETVQALQAMVSAARSMRQSVNVVS